MEEIKTIVYFDLEATGLKSSGKPRISELSFVAVNFQDILDFHLKIEECKEKARQMNSDKIEKLLPRVLNKLTLCVYPMATIVPQVSSITGLDNYNLSDQARFDKNTADMLNSFLNRLPSPVCLIAHNGDLYDFPLLKAEMENIGTALSSEIMCADSYTGIKDIFKKRDEIIQIQDSEILEAKQIKERQIIEEEMEAVATLMKAGEFETDMEYFHSRTSIDTSQRKRSMDCTSSTECLQHTNERTPVVCKTSVPKNVNPKKMKFDIARKKLTFSMSNTPKSYSLINLHEHFLGYLPAQSHGAEADCFTLLIITSVLGKEWLKWLQDNCKLFNDCKAMWGHTKRKK